MSFRYQSYFNTAVALIRNYDGSIPLVHYLKQYFSQHKKHGSKDRKLITHLCYCYYRLGHAVKEHTVEEKLKMAVFLCNDVAGEWTILFEADWISNWNSSLKLRIDFVEQNIPAFSVLDIFPWSDQLSGDAYDPYQFSLSHLIQPDLFLRIRPGHKETVKQKLESVGMPFTYITNECIALPNGSRIDNLLDIDREMVIQDRNSQKVGELFRLIDYRKETPLRVWDCCAASGGKSILAQDVLPAMVLTVSDVRSSILQNLKERFSKAEITPEKIFIADLSEPFHSALEPFDLVICDAPCTGSGTWGRTPEQLCYFSKEKMDSYAELQHKILSNLIKYLKPGGYLLYITCSVFAKENEASAEVISSAAMEVIKTIWLPGYDQKADSMFAALYKLRV